MKRHLIGFSALLLAIAGLSSCSESTSASSVAGSYSAIIFMTTGSSGQTNHLVAGSTFDITLDADGTTSGHLHIAASGGEPALDASMAGTWRQTGDVIDFTQAADTFVRDMAFRIERTGPNQLYLVGNQVFSGEQINVTLARDN